MIRAIRSYLSLLHTPPPPSERLQALALALDQLALTFHQTADGAPSTKAEPLIPQQSDDALRQLAAQAFPDFGLYPYAPPEGDLLADDTLTCVHVGDAIDDLADIARNLQEVLWRWEHIGADDAAWHFRLLYRAHWGRHLHNLRSYVHAKLFEH